MNRMMTLTLLLTLTVALIGCGKEEPAPTPPGPAASSSAGAAPVADTQKDHPAAAPDKPADTPHANAGDIADAHKEHVAAAEKNPPVPADAAAAPPGQTESAEGVAEVTITGNDQMMFSTKVFEVKAGQKVKLTLKNIGNFPKQAMGHNIVILVKGENAIAYGASIANPAASGAGFDTDFIPNKSPFKEKILHHTKLLGPGESDTIEFTAPTEPGDYPYLCTFTAHFALMNGKMVVK